MALPSNNQNNKDAIKGFAFIFFIIIVIIIVVLYFIPSDQEPIPELETKEDFIIDSAYTEAEGIRLALQYYNGAENAFQILYGHCSIISNRAEFNAFLSFIDDVEPELTDFVENDAEVTQIITRLGLYDNAEINTAANSYLHTLSLSTSCLEDVMYKYGQ